MRNAIGCVRSQQASHSCLIGEIYVRVLGEAARTHTEELQKAIRVSVAG